MLAFLMGNNILIHRIIIMYIPFFEIPTYVGFGTQVWTNPFWDYILPISFRYLTTSFSRLYLQYIFNAERKES
jgi:hypothetical protein